ncbi:MAG: ComF family protein [Elusimicrobiota bacterium]|jgi:ComF family protein|nr:ComF family protein [Elusimicrobiota bacterium]
MAYFNKIKNLLLHFFFPRVCFACGIDMDRKDNNLLCPTCQKDLKPIEGLICKRCGLPLKDGGAYCFNCRGSKAAKYKCSFIRSSLYFTPSSRALVHAFKYEKYIHIAKFFTPIIYKTYLKNPEYFEADLIVPVPIHKSRLKQRGFNQATLLASGLSAKIDVPLLEVLVRKRKTKSQTSLGRKARQENIKEAFICPSPALVKRKAILLIDDVCTTGATLEECAKVLKAAGAREVVALTVLRE